MCPPSYLATCTPTMLVTISVGSGAAQAPVLHDCAQALMYRIKLVQAVFCNRVWSDRAPRAHPPPHLFQDKVGHTRASWELYLGTDPELCGHPPLMMCMAFTGCLEILLD